MSPINIQKVENLDTNLLLPLAEESASEGFHHLDRLINEYADGSNQFDQDGEAFFIATLGSEIVGVCGLNRDPYADGADVGRVRRLYVRASARRFGIGRMLMASVIAEARKSYHLLVLRTDNPQADIFYRSIGFSINTDSNNHTHFLVLNVTNE
ncbi:GNAT family N-acetyltransferase [Paenibacillus chondroitinus]|uniref:GNAT family N-acetyltransferase n=1 Tax=Paenibacillus chondroitinus TaxID=59842 RepID=A0ABU6DB34_9BACL|nr:GNAT family N-acetyltransferase [Paenibacillus chondroitinus]MCY9659719.1 GNAT family N-acetyltransferase [Paenibacillus anseongense]MEB4794102.1 GNAT family N-acetyltransferase [Paenibacillus chondroitinus]